LLFDVVRASPPAGAAAGAPGVALGGVDLVVLGVFGAAAGFLAPALFPPVDLAMIVVLGEFLRNPVGVAERRQFSSLWGETGTQNW
jgi:hypothetical protein